MPDLQGDYQIKNYKTVLAALDLLGVEPDWDALAHTAARTGLRGRWETLRERPLTICDIGHNPPALRENFTQLRAMMDSGRYDRLLVVYGIMADKALDDIIPLMPRDADYYLVTPDTPRALPAAQIAAHLPQEAHICGSVADGIRQAEKNATENSLIYIGGSTFVVSEAVTYFDTL